MFAKRLGIDLGTANSVVWLAPALVTRFFADCLPASPNRGEFGRFENRVPVRDCATNDFGGFLCLRKDWE